MCSFFLPTYFLNKGIDFMNKEMLDKIVDDKEFSDCIADAVPLRVKVINDL